MHDFVVAGLQPAVLSPAFVPVLAAVGAPRCLSPSGRSSSSGPAAPRREWKPRVPSGPRAWRTEAVQRGATAAPLVLAIVVLVLVALEAARSLKRVVLQA